jgi:hypothetical protein
VTPQGGGHIQPLPDGKTLMARARSHPAIVLGSPGNVRYGPNCPDQLLIIVFVDI